MSSLFPSSAVRVLRAVFSSSKEETIGFVRFHDETIEANEVPMPNGTFSTRDLKNDECYGGTEGEAESKKENGMVAMSMDPVKDKSLADKKQERNRITAWQAGWNVTNAIQGMFIVTFPYAVYEGGYWAVFSMVIVAWICCYTGKILVECLYETDDEGVQQRVRTSYVQVAECVWGKTFGGRIVNCAQIIELLMTCILYILLCGDLMIGSFPNSPLDLASWIMLCSILLLPCAFLKSLRAVSWLSFWCTVAHLVINAVIIVYCLTLIKEWHWKDVQFKVDMWTFPISFGIVIFSYTSQIFLPTLEGNLVDRSQFTTMLHWTHVAAAVFKSLFSYIGFVTFGFATKEVITNNLENRGLKILVNMFLVAKSLLSYPLPYFAASDLLEESMFKGQPYTVGPSCFDGAGSLKVWALILRILLVALTVVMAIFIPHFAILMGLIGSFTGNMLSLVWPCYFHLKIKGHVMKMRYKFMDTMIIIIGFLCAVIGIYYNFHALVKAFQGIEPRPFQG